MSIANEITRLQTAKSDIKTSIENKGVTIPSNEKIDNYSDYIDEIETGGQGTDDSDATLNSNSQLLSGVTAYAKGTKYTGSMENKGSKTFTPSTTVQTATAGYYSDITVNAISTGALSTPTINTSTGVVTASVGTSGYLASGTNKTLQLSTQPTQTITPTTNNQIIESGKYLTGTQTISGDTNLVAENIKKNVTIFGVTGTHEGGGTTHGTKTITGNGTYDVSAYEYANVNVEGGVVSVLEKDVNFYDYDGTRLYSYTKTEFLALNDLPTNPTHSGLTSQGWNWNLSEAKTYVTEYGGLDIGQNYITNDGKTRIYINLQEGLLEPMLCIQLRGTIKVDWGDGSEVETYTRTSSLYQRHNYLQAGEYTILIEPINDVTVKPMNENNTSYLISNGNNNKPTMYYKNSIKKIEIGTNFLLNGYYAFSGLSGLQYITIPNSITTLGKNCFSGTTQLKCVVVPKNVTSLDSSCFSGSGAYKILLPKKATSIGESCFSSTYLLDRLYLSDSITQLPSTYIFSSSKSLSKLIVPKTVTSIGNQTFASSDSLALFDFTHFESIPTLGSNCFDNLPSVYQIWVPESLYDDWIAATNWSNISSHIVAK